MKKVYIDPGHGGSNPGATYGKRKESEDVFALAQTVADKLAAVTDVAVKLSRTAGSDPELNARTREANVWGADYFLSIHRNAFKPNKASGVEAWIYSKAAKGGDAWTKAARFTDGLSSVMGIGNRGVHLGAPNYTDYAVNRDSKMTSCLLEVGFVDNDRDNAAFDAHLLEMADAIAAAVCLNIGAEYVRKGDIDGDGDIDVSDARTALRAAVGLEKLSEKQKKAADVDGDGKVTVADAREILRTATEPNKRGGENV